jgi:hypothetical protein
MALDPDNTSKEKRKATNSANFADRTRVLNVTITLGALAQSSVKPLQSMTFGHGKRCTVLRRSDGSVQWRIFIRSVTGTVLVHQVKIGIGRDFMGDELQNFFRICKIIR